MDRYPMLDLKGSAADTNQQDRDYLDDERNAEISRDRTLAYSQTLQILDTQLCSTPP